ncbi:peptidylprolyl isomerase [Allohahella sp. A8]|uniref:peptidylprolyl isomerase n=1 Tax=Allohahella sp. A8 TaxID=3141461 RepID=UPI003A805E0F
MNSSSISFFRKISSAPLLLCLGLFTGLAGLATTATAEETLVDSVVVVVDDDIVLKQEVDARVDQIRKRIRRDGGTPPPRTELEQRIVEQLINERIQLQMARRAGLRVNDSQLNETLSTIARENGMTPEQFEEALKQDGLSLSEAREQIRREMLMGRLQQRNVEPRVRVTDREVNDYLASAAGQAQSEKEYRLAHILIEVPSGGNADPASNETLQRVLKSLKEGEDFAALAREYSDSGTASEGGDLGWRKATDLPGLFSPVVPDLKVGEVSRPLTTPGGLHLVKLVEQRGGTQKVVQQTLTDHILISPGALRSEAQAEKLIGEIDQRLEAGESFEALARSYSDDPVSASNGGSLEWASPGQTVPEFEQVMNQTPVGETSEPFQSQFGWHILRVRDRREQDQSERFMFVEAKNSISKRKFQEALTKWRTEIRDEAFVEFRDKRFAPQDGSDS